MLFKRLNRDLAEAVFIIGENNEGSTIPKDAAVQLDLTSDIDGVKVRQPDTGQLAAFLGVADQAIANDGFGLIQVFGYRSSSIMFQTDTSVAAGAPIGPVAGQNYLQSYASTVASLLAAAQWAVLGENVASSSASATISTKMFLRAL